MVVLDRSIDWGLTPFLMCQHTNTAHTGWRWPKAPRPSRRCACSSTRRRPPRRLDWEGSDVHTLGMCRVGPNAMEERNRKQKRGRGVSDEVCRSPRCCLVCFSNHRDFVGTALVWGGKIDGLPSQTNQSLSCPKKKLTAKRSTRAMAPEPRFCVTQNNKSAGGHSGNSALGRVPGLGHDEPTKHLSQACAANEKKNARPLKARWTRHTKKSSDSADVGLPPESRHNDRTGNCLPWVDQGQWGSKPGP